MPYRKARPWALTTVGAAILLLAGCGPSAKDPDQAARAHPAADPPSRLCSLVGPPLLRQAVPGATGPAKSTTIDQRRDAFVNRTLAQCTLRGSGTSLLVTLTRYGPARDGDGTTNVRGGIERAKALFTADCRDTLTGHPSPLAEHADDQDCLTGSPSRTGHPYEAFYRSRHGSDEITVKHAVDRPGAHPTTTQAASLDTGIARNIWQKLK